MAPEMFIYALITGMQFAAYDMLTGLNNWFPYMKNAVVYDGNEMYNLSTPTLHRQNAAARKGYLVFTIKR